MLKLVCWMAETFVYR